LTEPIGIVREINPSTSEDPDSARLVKALSLSFFVDCKNPGGNVAVVSRGKVISSDVTNDPNSSDSNPIKALEQNGAPKPYL